MKQLGYDWIHKICQKSQKLGQKEKPSLFENSPFNDNFDDDAIRYLEVCKIIMEFRQGVGDDVFYEQWLKVC